MSFSALGADELAHVLAFASARDVEALTVAARVVAREVLPKNPAVWRGLFLRQWEALNFPLPGVRDGSAALVLDPRVGLLFDSKTTESRKFQVLAHAVGRVPSFADVASTRHAALYSDQEHRITVLAQQQALQGGRRREPRPTDLAFDGDVLGYNRTVRANSSLASKFHVAVFATETRPAKLSRSSKDFRRYYVVGVAASGYFEASISAREHSHAVARRLRGEDVVAIGLVSDRFPLVGRQPGWRGRSYGYHGDDGRLFHHSGEVGGEPFGPRFAAGDTVGCGVRNDMHDGRTTVFFTKNGSIVNERLSQHDCVEWRAEHEWYPAIGLDTYDAVHVNFGQEPFQLRSAIDKLLGESVDSKARVWKDLGWHGICDGGEDAVPYLKAQEAGWNEEEEPMWSFILRTLERRAVLLGSDSE